MSATGQTVGSWTLVASADVPEPGTWYRAEPRAEGHAGLVEAWVRVLDADEDIRAIELAAERVKHLEHEAFPRPVWLDREARALVVAAPAGASLERVLQHRLEPAFVVTPSTLLDLALQLTEAIVRAHERGRPHGHLSPGQIWLTPEGRIVVWGIGPGPDAACEPAWCPPERARGRRASGDADQWAVAAIVAALAIGRVPWSGPDAAAQLEQASLGQLAHLVEPVTQQWRQLGLTITRALASEPKDRWPSLHTLRQSFHAMSERVRAPSDLAAMGAELARRYGLPGVTGAAGPSPVWVEDAPTQPGLDVPPPDGAESSTGSRRAAKASKRAAVSASPTGRLIRSALEAVPEVEDGSAHPTMVPDPSVWEFAGGLDATGVEAFDAPTDAGARVDRVVGGARGLQAAEPSPAPSLVWEEAAGVSPADLAGGSSAPSDAVTETPATGGGDAGLFALPKRRARSRGVLSAARVAERAVVGDEVVGPDAAVPEGAPSEPVDGRIEADAPSEEEPPTQVREEGAHPDEGTVGARLVAPRSEPEVAGEAAASSLDVPAFTEEEPPTQVGEVAAEPAAEASSSDNASPEAEPVAAVASSEPAPVAAEGVGPDAATGFEEEPPTRPGVLWTADAEALAEAPPPPRVRSAAVTPVEAKDDGEPRASSRPAPARPTKAARAIGPRPVVAIPVGEPEPFTQAEAPTQPDGPPIDLPVEPLDALPKMPDVWAGPAWDEASAEEEDDARPVVSEQLADVSPAVAARARLSAAVSDGPGSTVWEVESGDRGRAGSREGRPGPRPEPIGVVFPTDPQGVDPRQVALWLGGAALVTMLGWVLFG
jgi:hypothetical protein